MVRSKRLGRLVLISVFIFILSAHLAYAQELTPAKKTVVSWVDGSKERFEELAKYLWNNPELSLVEYKASARLQDDLAKNGFRIEKGVAGMPTAFVATWGSGKPVIGFLCEFDALPGLSQTAEKAVKEAIVAGGSGHGCGHNIYASVATTAAIAAKVAMEKHGIKGTIKLFGTPAEETLVGKIFMARDGVFNGTDIMIGYHPMDYNGIDLSSNLAMTTLNFDNSPTHLLLFNTPSVKRAFIHLLTGRGKTLFYRLLKKVQVQGARNSEE
ncbi:MAG: hypothetical protein L7F78_09420 [Syntrophales bacterium LBB04]|nr:hypothetical protein [Syntrophales bacterium LBB04]